MIHACGQFGAAEWIAFGPGLVAAARDALKRGAPILLQCPRNGGAWHHARSSAQNEVVCSLRDERIPPLAANSA